MAVPALGAPSFLPLRWGFVFLHCPLRLTDDQRLGLVELAVRAFFEDSASIPFDWPCCRGEVRVTSDAVTMGAFSGQRFAADVHVPEGSGRVEFLVTEAQLQASRGPVAEA
ncbi:MAG: hypothetical protein JXB39_17010 [Deltaproteobacteria bacterium]|nr:hypothetical protein [Deltaproteobacteria bacterium]